MPKLSLDSEMVRIANPAAGGPRLMTFRSASRLVRREQARWVDPAKTWLQITDGKLRLTMENQARIEQDLAQERIDRRMTAEEVRGLPLLLPERLMVRKTTRGPGGGPGGGRPRRSSDVGK